MDPAIAEVQAQDALRQEFLAVKGDETDSLRPARCLPKRPAALARDAAVEHGVHDQEPPLIEAEIPVRRVGRGKNFADPRFVFFQAPVQSIENLIAHLAGAPAAIGKYRPECRRDGRSEPG